MLVIYAEKSSLAKAIANALGAGDRISYPEEPKIGYYEFEFNGEKAVICHGIGHLANLVPAKSYDEKYSKWDLSVFPCIPTEFKKAPKASTIKCIRLVKSFFDKANWIINAADPDREGELIFTYVYEVCKCSKPYKRVWIEDLTNQKIRYAFSNLKNPDKNLQLAGRARDISDWLIGTNLTVAATKKYGSYNNLLTVGRVQTPTLNLVVEREKAIKNHVKEPYWKLISVFSSPMISLKLNMNKGILKTNQKQMQFLLNAMEKAV